MLLLGKDASIFSSISISTLLKFNAYIHIAIDR